MIANRRRWGTASRKNSSRLSVVSDCCGDRPVTLPPGRARLATMPDAKRIRLPREHDYVSSVRVVGGEVRNAGTEAGLMLAGADDW